MRAAPSINAELVTLRRYIPGLGVFYSSHLTYRNAFKSFDAVTVRQDTIDGITAPWYRISVMLDEIYQEYVWVFGGYVRELEPHEFNTPQAMRRMYDTFYHTLLDMGIIRHQDIRYPF